MIAFDPNSPNTPEERQMNRVALIVLVGSCLVLCAIVILAIVWIR